MNRRRLLQMGMATGALGTAGLLGGVAGLQPRSEVHPAVGTGTRTEPDGARRVVVIGGGLAGISTAACLARKGYAVELFEQSDRLGGKLAGWPIQVGGTGGTAGLEMPMEHGFHGFFKQYYNLLALLDDAGATQDLVPQDGYTVLYRDQPAEPFGRAALPFPFDLLEIVARSPGLTLEDVSGDRPGMRELLAYDPVETFARWDAASTEEFIAESGLDGRFADLVLRPFGQASMNSLEGFSAAEAVRFFHFYMLGNPEGLGFSALGRGVHLSILDPLRAHLESLGVTIHLNTPVRRVAFEDGRAIGAVIGGAAAQDDVHVPAESLAAFPDEGWVLVGPEAVLRRSTRHATGFEARSLRCTHMGCPVGIDGAGFRCPCHAGQYDRDGRPIAGPPPRPLEPLDVVLEAEGLVLRGRAGTTETLVRGDAVVLATEVRGLQALSSASDLTTHAPRLAGAAAASGEADPYSVVRFWFDRPIDPSHPAFYTVAGFEWTDGLAAYSSFQEAAQRWASQTGGSIVETHAYAIPPERQGSLSSYRDALLEELLEVFPELEGARIVHEEAMTQSNFSRFAPGDFARRPTVDTDVDNLFVAGDHVKLPFPAFLMEAAVASGRLAANHILAADDVLEVPIPTVATRGQLAGVL